MIDKTTRVGIITRHCYPNYGSLLQTYALSTALANAGADVRVVNYVPEDDTPRGLVASSLRESRMAESQPKRLTFRAVQGPNLVYMARRFRAFQNDLLTLTDEVRSLHAQSPVWQGLDTVVTGSDQVWAPIHDKIDPTYFLATSPDTVRKVSYAASLGSARPRSADEGRVTDLISKIETVSVREATSAEYLGEVGIEARVDVDPVLLHDGHFWSKFAGPRTGGGDPYILVYQLHNTPGFDAAVQELSRARKLPVRRVTVDAKQLIRTGKTQYLRPPVEFVRHVRDASAVVTDSFHGSVFSLIFGTPLSAIAPAKHTARMTDLLATVGLARLMVTPESDVKTHDPEYCGRDATASLRILRAGSLDYVGSIARNTPC